MASLYRAYLHQLRVNTLRTQMATSAVMMGMGDLITQQLILGRGFDHDLKSTARFAFYGGGLWAPCSNRWHYLLSKVKLSTHLRTTLVRFIIDASIFSPFATFWFFLCMGPLEGRSVAETRQRIQKNLIPVTTTMWSVYCPAQLINLTIMPLYARPPFLNVVGVLWTAYLASFNHKLNENSTAAERREAEVEGIAATVTTVME